MINANSNAAFYLPFLKNTKKARNRGLFRHFAKNLTKHYPYIQKANNAISHPKNAWIN